MTSTERETASSAGKADGRKSVLFALMLTVGLVALDSTIVATAIPSIVRDIGGFSEFPWLFSIYLLTQAVAVPLYGKFADVIGRKPVLFVGISLFVVGSLLCGVAWSMTTLIVFRGVQGLGAGAVIPISTTIIGDMYSLEERGRIQGYTASVWGAAAVLGPTLGGLFSEYFTWRWIFFINLPLGAAAVWMLARHFPESVARRRHVIDVGGAVTLTVGCSLLILGLLEGGVSWAWLSGRSYLSFTVAAALLLAFLAIERRVAEPVLPLWVFRRRVLLAGSLASAMIGALTIGLSSYVPTYVQGIKGTGAVVAGFTLAAMTIGWPLAASRAGAVYMRIGFRDTALIGSVFIVAGAVLFALLRPASSLWHVALASFVVGLGLGFAATATVVSAQSVVGWDRRGVVTATNMFSRSLGSAVGVAVLGAIANSTLAAHLRHPPAALAGRLPHSVDTTSLVLGGHGREPAAVQAFIRTGLYDGTHRIFLALVVVALLGAAFQALMPRRTTELTF